MIDEAMPRAEFQWWLAGSFVIIGTALAWVLTHLRERAAAKNDLTDWQRRIEGRLSTLEADRNAMRDGLASAMRRGNYLAAVMQQRGDIPLHESDDP